MTNSKTSTFIISKPTGFRLEAAREFYAGFTPGSGMAPLLSGRAASENTRALTLAFRLDRTYEAVAVALRESVDQQTIIGEFAGVDTTRAPDVRAQISRMLGLDVDGNAWLAIGERDPIVGNLQRSFAGFFTAAKASPYDAATWAIIAPRIAMQHAAHLKIAMAEAHGDTVTLREHTHYVFPAPAQLAELESFAGLSLEKVDRLRGVARAALDGKLDANRLRAMTEEDALDELQTLRGVGPWAASHIYYRGAAPLDALPTVEPRVLHGFAHAYGLPSTPTDAQFRKAADAWRPFRMWVVVLLSRNLARDPQGGWHAPELARERAIAGQKLARATERRRNAGGKSRVIDR